MRQGLPRHDGPTPARRKTWRSPSAWQELPAPARAYVVVVSAAGTALVAWSLPALAGPDQVLLAVLVLLAIPVSLVKVRFPRTLSTLTMSHVLNYLALLTLGTRSAVLVAAAGAWSQCTFRSRQPNATHRTWFSVAGIALAMQISGVVYLTLGGKPGAWDASTALVPFAAATTAFFILNSGLVAAAIGLATARPPGGLWSETFLSTWPGYLLGAAVAGASVFAMRRGALWLVLFLAIPFALSFYNLRAYLERTNEAATDPLTGLPNQRFVLAHAARELDRAKRHGDGLTFLVADLDGFKAINDLHGHRAGDRALRHVARHLQSAIDPSDVCARYGGDEFLVVLSGCASAEGEARARELQRVVGSLLFGLAPSMELSIRISVGTAAYPEDGDSVESLLDAADLRMYQDKLVRGRPSDPSLVATRGGA